MSNKARLMLIVFAALLASACGDSSFWDSSCESEMDDVRARMGAPEDVNTYTSGDYQSVSWWYWTRGISYTFTYYQECRISTYTFTPTGG